MSDSGLSDEHREALKSAFDDIDVNKSGTISKSELRTALQLIGQNPTAEEIATYMEGVEDGEFTREEFESFVEKHIPLKTKDELDKEIMEAFEKFDEDQDLFITREEFRKVMTKLGDEPLSEEDADVLLDNLDVDEKDGKLSVAELARLFLG